MKIKNFPQTQRALTFQRWLMPMVRLGEINGASSESESRCVLGSAYSKKSTISSSFLVNSLSCYLSGHQIRNRYVVSLSRLSYYADFYSNFSFRILVGGQIDLKMDRVSSATIVSSFFFFVHHQSYTNAI